MLCIAYSATIGGIGTIIGTPPKFVIPPQMDPLHGGIDVIDEEIERRHMVDNPDHILRFTTKELMSVVTSLVIAYTVNAYHHNHEGNEPIREFGYLIRRQESGQWAPSS